jgi:hypothetical protein
MSPMAQFAAVCAVCLAALGYALATAGAIFVTLLLLLYGFRAANKEAPAAPPVEE